MAPGPGSRRDTPPAGIKRRGRSRLRAPGGPAMMIERDVPVPAGDGVVLRADVFRPEGPGRYPVILSYGPYAKGLAFQEGYADQWRLMTEAHPDVARGSSNVHQNWEVVEPGKMGAGRVLLRPGGLTRGGPVAGPARPLLAAGDPGPVRMHRVGGGTAVEHREDRPQRDLLLRDEPVARGRPAPAAPGRHVRVGGRRPTSTGTAPTTAGSSPRSGRTGMASRSPWSSTGWGRRARATR